MNTTSHTSEKHDRNSSDVQAEIRETRGRMDATLDELGHRLTARSLVNSALDWWEAPANGNQANVALRKGIRTAAREAREHPMPTLLIGSGIAWLVSETMRHDGGNGWHHENGDGTSGKFARAREATGDAMETARDKSSEIGDKLHDATGKLQHRAKDALASGKSAAGHLAGEVRHGYEAGTEKFTRACDDYPLAMGVAFAALGALAGLVLPNTRKEDEMLGEKSAELRDQAKQGAEDMLESGKEIGTRLAHAVTEEIHEQGIDEKISETAADLAERGGEVARKIKDEAARAAEEKNLMPPNEKPASSEAHG